MKPLRIGAVMALFVIVNGAVLADTPTKEPGQHLFVVVGQLGNTILDPKDSFTPALNDTFGKDNVIVVAADNDVESVQAWKESIKNAQRKRNRDLSSPLYPALSKKLWPAIRRKKIASATLIWLVGENDARKGLAEAHYKNLKEMIWAFKKGMGRADLNVVIGRIPKTNPETAYTALVREAQVRVAKEMVRADWVDTDDVSTLKDGMAVLQKRLAEKAVSLIKNAPKGKHLFLLSGQSNMGNLHPDNQFTQIVGGNLGITKVVRVAEGGQPMRRWYKQWKPLGGTTPEKTGDLYDKLISEMKRRAGDPKSYDTVTFVWMQGESDTVKGQAEVYLDSVKGLVAQLKKDLGRDDLDVVIGRINTNSRAMRHEEKARAWQMVREAQVQATKDIPRAVWVNTDDLCNEESEAHMTGDGYTILGERFAKEALKLIRKRNGAGPAIEK